MKVIKSLENREILLKETTRKITRQEGGFLNFLKPLMTAGLPLIKDVLTSLAKIFLIPLRLTAEASATDAAIQKKIYGSGLTALIITNEKMEDIMKTVKSPEESGLIIKGINETIKNESKEHKDGFLEILLDTLAASLLGSASTERRVTKAGEGTIRAA